jgi:hypothetical protein
MSEIERFRKTVGDVFIQTDPAQDIARRSNCQDRFVLARVGTGGHDNGLQEVVLGADFLDLVYDDIAPIWAPRWYANSAAR